MSLFPASLRTVYIDEHLDQAICGRAETRRSTRARVFHSWLTSGIKACKRSQQRPPQLGEPTAPLHLKMVRISGDVDVLLDAQALDFKVSRNDLIRGYLTLGKQASEKAATRSRARQRAGVNAAHGEATQAS